MKTRRWLPAVLKKVFGAANRFEKRDRLKQFCRLGCEELEDRAVPAAPFAEFIDPHPAAGNQFGAAVVPLNTGNVVITSPFDDAGGTDAGAVYLFNGATGALISTLTGSRRFLSSTTTRHPSSARVP